MAGISALTVSVAVPDAGGLVAALAATNKTEPTWQAVTGAAAQGRTCTLVEVQELSGLGWYHGRYQDPAEAARQAGPRGDWHLERDGVPPTLVGEPVTAVVLRRIERRDDDD